MHNKVKISFVIPKNLQKEMRERIVTDGYSLKGKSQWVANAIKDLFEKRSYADLVKVNDEMAGFEQFESILIDKSLKNDLNESIINIRKKYPEIDGVQSRIIRTAILQKLL